ncbi:MAG: glycosyltransferase, partial [Thermoproteota archaeon]
MVEGLVSVIIPTRNSSATLESCIHSVKNQTYNPIEIIVVDSKSTDSTRHISESNGVKVVEVEWKLLGARLLGLREASGNHILMLDSDQILNAEAIGNCMKMMKEFDMLCLEERTYNPQTFIQRAFEAD